MYEIEVEPVEIPLSASLNLINQSQTVSTNNTYDWSQVTTTWPTTYYWSYPYTKYMYQLTCPKRGCKTLNWCELDQTTTCKKCKSQLKAVSKKADFEIEVGG